MSALRGHAQARLVLGLIAVIALGVVTIMWVRRSSLDDGAAGVQVPQATRERMRAAGEAGAAAGLEIAMEHVEQTVDLDFVSGIYIMPSFGRYEVAAEMVRQVRASQAEA